MDGTNDDLPDENNSTIVDLENPDRQFHPRLGVKEELLLASLPTAAVLLVLATVEALTSQRVLFASLASSAFLIYLEPRHKANSVRSIVIGHLTGATIGLTMDHAFGAGYLAAGVAMTATIIVLIALDAVHPPAIGTSLSFAFRQADDDAFPIFLLSLLVIVVLVIVQRAVLRMLERFTRS